MKYRVKVTEMHSGYAWVEADSPSEAEDKAVELAECEFECVYSYEATGRRRIDMSSDLLKGVAKARSFPEPSTGIGYSANITAGNLVECIRCWGIDKVSAELLRDEVFKAIEQYVRLADFKSSIDEFKPSDNYNCLLKQARSLLRWGQSQERAKKFAEQLVAELRDEQALNSKTELDSQREANQTLQLELDAANKRISELEGKRCASCEALSPLSRCQN